MQVVITSHQSLVIRIDSNASQRDRAGMQFKTVTALEGQVLKKGYGRIRLKSPMIFSTRSTIRIHKVFSWWNRAIIRTINTCLTWIVPTTSSTGKYPFPAQRNRRARRRWSNKVGVRICVAPQLMQTNIVEARHERGRIDSNEGISHHIPIRTHPTPQPNRITLNVPPSARLIVPK
jgi:hypothetical protein